MDYEKKYKEALERAREYWETDNDNTLDIKAKGTMEYLFPELKESEGEKVRKALVEMVHDTTGDELWVDYNVHKEEALAWLEKQGEQKPILDFKAKDWYVSKVDGKIRNIYHSVDKVEPKFKVGDWVVYYRNDSSREVLQVYDIRDGRYYFTDNVHFSWSVKECDEKSHLWTIQDAKDGDVLVTIFEEDNMIVMYRSMCTIDTINVHCCLDNKFVCWNLGVFNAEDVIPATKEQHDLLFQKMHEAGYEWDADKKELKKISQRMISAEAKEAMYAKTAWSEEDEEMRLTVLQDLQNIKESYPNVNVEPEFDWLKSLKPQSYWKPSEEQIEILDMVLTNESMDDNIARILLELRGQLKKLREE